MANKNTVKTTIELDKDLYKQVKIAALNQDKTIKDFLQDSLKETIRKTSPKVKRSKKDYDLMDLAGIIKDDTLPPDFSENLGKYMQEFWRTKDL